LSDYNKKLRFDIEQEMSVRAEIKKKDTVELYRVESETA